MNPIGGLFLKKTHCSELPSSFVKRMESVTFSGFVPKDHCPRLSSSLKPDTFGRRAEELKEKRNTSNAYLPPPPQLRRGIEKSRLYRNASGHVARIGAALVAAASGE